MRDLLNVCIKISGYYLCLLGSFLLAYHIKYCFMLPRYIQPIMWTGALWIVSIKVVVLYAAGEFRNLFAYFRFPDLAKIVVCLTTIAFGELCFRYYQVPYWIPQREVILSDLLFSILFVFFVRAFVRLIHAHFIEIDSESKAPFVTRVALIGINESTSHLIAELKERSFLKIKPIIGFKNGKVSVIAKKIGIKNGMKYICEQLKELECDENYDIIASYTYNKKNLDTLIEMADEKYRPLMKVVDNLDPAIACHWGPGAFGFIFVAKK